jgi:hypothetical protein
LSKSDKLKVETIEIGEFSVIRFFSKPQRIEAKVVFDKENISQKLIFRLMEITHMHGFGCSNPHFGDINDNYMLFFIGTTLPSPRSLKKYLQKMYNCLLDIRDFQNEFERQFDFSKVDISMFSNQNIDGFYPEHVAAVRDQHYNGSWTSLKNSLIEEGKLEDARLIDSCIKFETINDKDIGLIGHQLSKMLYLIDGLETNEAN